MAANNGGGNSTGKKNYYNISYGMLSANAKTAPEGYETMSLADIKSRRVKNENVDLRNKYYDTENGKDYPLRVFYTDIDGVIESIVKNKYSQGISLVLTLHDQDGDESILQTDFYGKIAADLLNRLLNVTPENELNFRPYAIPSTFETAKKETINFYQSGVSIKDGGNKTERFYKGLDSGLPKTEQIVNGKGENETSRVKQINFLWEKVEAKFAAINKDAGLNTEPETASENSVQAKEVKETVNKAPVEHDDLPF